MVQAGYDEEDGIRMRSWEFLAVVAVVLPSSGVGIACTFTIRCVRTANIYEEVATLDLIGQQWVLPPASQDLSNW